MGSGDSAGMWSWDLWANRLGGLVDVYFDDFFETVVVEHWGLGWWAAGHHEFEAVLTGLFLNSAAAVVSVAGFESFYEKEQGKGDYGDEEDRSDGHSDAVTVGVQVNLDKAPSRVFFGLSGAVR